MVIQKVKHAEDQNRKVSNTLAVSCEFIKKRINKNGEKQ